jgi:hypothetical protein
MHRGSRCCVSFHVLKGSTISSAGRRDQRICNADQIHLDVPLLRCFRDDVANAHHRMVAGSLTTICPASAIEYRFYVIYCLPAKQHRIQASGNAHT